MKIPTTIALVLAVSLFASAQTTPPPAPDFTVTTFDGSQHSLYADYLNQGKAVVIYLFFTTCPLCNDIAPLIEPFYQEWGGGSGTAEFISMSTLNNDDNTDVAQYHGVKNFTFPGVGSDGGAMQAIKPYTNGTYGSFFGTPTFVVIAPDGTVQYNPRGDYYSETIDSLDQALRRVVAKPATNFPISGAIANPNSIPISGVEISVKNSDFSPITSGPSGKFDITAPLVARDLYGMRFQRKGGYVDGVSTYDIVRIQRHLLGIEPFTSPYQYLAADVDHSGSINIADIIQLRKLILSVQTTLPGDRSWVFINGNYTFSNPQNPFYEAYFGDAATFAINTRDEVIPPVSVIAIKIGDMDFNAQ